MQAPQRARPAAIRLDGLSILGVISHRTNAVEHPELVAHRMVLYAEAVGRENVIAGTDCGFAQGPFRRRVHPSIMWAKLEALSEGVDKVGTYRWPVHAQLHHRTISARRSL